MPTQLLRRLDTWLGLPLVWVLRVFTRAPRSLHGESLGRTPRSVVCCKLMGLGSTVLALPLLERLDSAGIAIAIVCFPASAAFLRQTVPRARLLVVRPSPRHFLRDVWRLFRALRRERAECFLDLEPTSNLSAALARSSGCRYRMGFLAGKPPRERMFTHLVSYSGERHLAENFCLFATRLGVPAAPFEPRPTSPRRDGSRPLRIVANLNTSDLSHQRLWPAESWIALCEKLLARFAAAEIRFSGLPRESARVARVIAGLSGRSAKRVRDLSGTTDFEELVDVIRDSDLVISVDSAIMHLAAWCGRPVVGLFGPESPRAVAPLGAKITCLSANLPCSPCLKVVTHKETRCRDNQCMKALGPDRVFRAALAYLDPMTS